MTRTKALFKKSPNISFNISMRLFAYAVIQSLLIFFAGYQANAQSKATIIGRFRIKNPAGNYYGGKKTMVFSQGGGKRKIYHVAKNDSGYFMFRVPHGYNSLTGIGYFSGGHFGLALPKDYAEVKLPNGSEVYYIGDIAVNWDINVQAALVTETHGGELTLVGVGSALRSKGFLYNQKEKRSPIQVSNEPATIARFAALMGLTPDQIHVSLMYFSKGF